MTVQPDWVSNATPILIYVFKLAAPRLRPHYMFEFERFARVRCPLVERERVSFKLVDDSILYQQQERAGVRDAIDFNSNIFQPKWFVRIYAGNILLNGKVRKEPSASNVSLLYCCNGKLFPQHILHFGSEITVSDEGFGSFFFQKRKMVHISQFTIPERATRSARRGLRKTCMTKSCKRLATRRSEQNSISSRIAAGRAMGRDQCNPSCTASEWPLPLLRMAMESRVPIRAGSAVHVYYALRRKARHVPGRAIASVWASSRLAGAGAPGSGYIFGAMDSRKNAQ
jgi:hypothetical protein